MKILIALLIALVICANVAAQTTEFTYQGRLVDGSLPANANYDFTFRLFDVDAGGTSIAGQLISGVSVSNGIFSVHLDFGDNFDGGPRWLEIAVRPAGPGSYTTLNPRQPIGSTPYSIRSLNAASATNSFQLGGVDANQFVVTTDPRMADARDPLPNSGNYVQNTASQQAASNFNISGNGTAGGTITGNAITSETQFNIGVNHALSIRGLTNVFVGRLSGVSNTTGNGNSFFGESSGRFNTNGGNNSFFGRSSGELNTASNNSFFGAFSGDSNTTGENNAFFGSRAGSANIDGNSGAFFGFEAGRVDTVGGNSYFGARAGRSNTTGLFNAFFGTNAGSSNVDADYNSFFGYAAGAQSTGQNNSFFGSLAGTANTTGGSNSFFGDEAGEANTTGSRNTFIGRWSGNSNTTGADNTFIGFNTGLLNVTGTGNVYIGLFAGGGAGGSNNTVIGTNADIPFASTVSYATAIGADSQVTTSNTIQLGRTNGFDTVFAPGLIRVNGLGVAGATDICRNASNQLSTCSSSLRYKTDIQLFAGGLEIVRRLKPISFRWNNGGIADLGFGAEEVNAVEPLLVTRNEKGDIEGVKYKQIATVLVNAVNEQQAQIEELSKRIVEQNTQIEELKRIVCLSNPQEKLCREDR